MMRLMMHAFVLRGFLELLFKGEIDDDVGSAAHI